jgi:hypothetical protein
MIGLDKIHTQNSKNRNSSNTTLTTAES